MTNYMGILMGQIFREQIPEQGNRATTGRLSILFRASVSNLIVRCNRELLVVKINLEY